eukprot:scaffold7381_cov310-Pinguiococcus_pyrenoidosus.AAC.74
MHPCGAEASSGDCIPKNTAWWTFPESLASSASGRQVTCRYSSCLDAGYVASREGRQLGYNSTQCLAAGRGYKRFHWRYTTTSPENLRSFLSHMLGVAVKGSPALAPAESESKGAPSGRPIVNWRPSTKTEW